MTPRQLYKSLYIIDRALRNQGSSLKELTKALKHAQKKSKTKLTFGQVMVGILHKQNVKLKLQAISTSRESPQKIKAHIVYIKLRKCLFISRNCYIFRFNNRLFKSDMGFGFNGES